MNDEGIRWQDFPPVSYVEWRGLVEAELGGGSFDDLLVSRTLDGVPVEPLYARPHALASASRLVQWLASSRRPGQRWEVWLELAASDLSDGAAILETARERGVETLWLRCDGAGPLHEGISASELAGLLSKVPLDCMGLVLETGAWGFPLAVTSLEALRRIGRGFGRLRGCLGLDPLGRLAVQGELPSETPRALRILSDLAAWCAEQAPGLRTALVSALPYSAAGASSAQELVFSMATALEYLRALIRGGLPLDQAAGQLLFAFGVGRDYLEQIAKLRAARWLWAKLVGAFGGGQSAQRMWLHARTDWRTKTLYDPWVNAVRAAVESFAAVVGGADSLSTSPWDETRTAPREPSVRLALNTQLILREECQLHRVDDPAGGSWYVEHLTDALARQAWGQLQEIEGRGGMASALQQGAVAAQLEKMAARRRRLLAEGRWPVTGVSAFPMTDEDLPETAPEVAIASRAEAPRRPADRRGAESAERTDAQPGLGAWTETALRQARLGATLAELAVSFEGGSGVVVAPALRRWRDAEPFEALRLASQRLAAQQGGGLVAGLLLLDQSAECRERAGMTRRLLSVAAVKVRELGGEGSPEDLVQRFADQGLRAAVLCGSDETYEARAGALVAPLRRAGVACIAFAGRRPESPRGAVHAVDLFLCEGGEALSGLWSLVRCLGVTA